MEYEELRFLLGINVHGADRGKVRSIGTYFDLQNMFAHWIGNEVTPYGNLDEEALEEALVTGVGLPDYVVSFLEKYQETAERVALFPKLVADFFNEEISRTSGFVKTFLEFERSTRLVLTALRAKELGRDVVRELQFEDPNDDLVAQILAQKDAKAYEPPARWEDLKAYWDAHKESPMDLFQAQARYRFETIEELLGVDLFSIDMMFASGNGLVPSVLGVSSCRWSARSAWSGTGVGLGLPRCQVGGGVRRPHGFRGS